MRSEKLWGGQRAGGPPGFGICCLPPGVGSPAAEQEFPAWLSAEAAAAMLSAAVGLRGRLCLRQVSPSCSGAAVWDLPGAEGSGCCSRGRSSRGLQSEPYALCVNCYLMCGAVRLGVNCYSISVWFWYFSVGFGSVVSVVWRSLQKRCENPSRDGEMKLIHEADL